MAMINIEQENAACYNENDLRDGGANTNEKTMNGHYAHYVSEICECSPRLQYDQQLEII